MRISFETRLRLYSHLSAILFYECFDLYLCIFWNLYSRPTENPHVGKCTVVIILVIINFVMFLDSSPCQSVYQKQSN